MFTLALLLILPVRAADTTAELADLLGVQAVEAAGREADMPDSAGVLGGFDPDEALGGLIGKNLKASLLTKALRTAAAVLLITLGCSMVKSVAQPLEGGLDAVLLAGAVAVALVVTGSQESLMELGFQTIAKLQDFANVLLPVLCGAAAASGQVTAATTKYTAAALFLNVLVNLIQTLVAPLIRLYFAAAVAEAAAGSAVTSALGFIKWLIGALLTCVMLAFTLYLSLCAVTSGAADAALVRSAKTLVSSAVPVVGSIAADAASSILASAAVIQKAVGVYGLVAVAAVALGPFLRVGAYYLVFRGAAALSGGLADDRLAKLTSRFSEAMGMTLGCLGSCALLLYFSIFSMIGVMSI